MHRRKAWVVEEERRRSEAWEVVGEHRSMAWVVAAAEGEVVEGFVENEGSGWTAWQVWGFGEVGGVRRYVRRIVVRKTGKEEVRRVRLVYDFAGELV